MTGLLVVEDERVTRHRVQRMVETAGYEVTSAANGREALTTIDSKRFDIVLLDIWLPDMNGFEILKQISERHPSVRVIVMTADDTPQTLLDAVRGAAYAFIAKPVDPDALLSVLGKAAERKTETAPIRVLSAKPHWVELGVPCERDAAERIQSFLSRLEADLEPDDREAVGRVFREMLLNAIEWGGELDPSREVRVTYLRAKRMILYRIADPGKGFRFDELNHAAISNTEDNPIGHMMSRAEKGIRAGGFGILMAQTLADELLYNEAQNEVVFVKYLKDADADV